MRPVSRGGRSAGWLFAGTFLLLAVPAWAEDPPAGSAVDPCQAGARVGLREAAPPEDADLTVPVQQEVLPTDGSFTQAFPIPVLEGRAGIAPELIARYRSSAAANGALGAGWSFEIGSIGLSSRPESSLATPLYEIRLPAGTSDLVPCSALPGEYRARFEESFFRFQRLPAADGGFRWEVTARDGKRYSFGANAGSRVAAPGDPAKIVEWALDGVVDRSGNFLEIDHRAEEGSLLPAEIRYTGHRNADGVVDLAPTLRLELRWELRHDPITSYRFGFRRRLSHRLESLVFHAGGELQRTVRFRYERSRATGRSLLTEMVTVGADGVADQPITFSYSQPALQLSAPQTEVVVAAPPRWASADATAKAVSKSSLRFGDVDGDARADACFLTGSGFDCWLSEEVSTEVTIEVTDNRGTHEMVVTRREDRWARQLPGSTLKPWTGAPWRQVVRTAGIRLVDVNADGLADACARDADGVFCQLRPDWREVRGPQWKDADGWNEFATGGTLSFPDLDGDGFADVCARGVNGLTCALGTGDGFGPVFDGPRWSNASGWDHVDRYATILYPDLDGDGGADVCARAAEGITCAMFTGPGFAAPQQTSAAWSDVAGWRDSDQYGTIAFPDLNGDGLADLCGRRPDGQMSCFLGSGGDFVTAVPAPALPDGEGWAKLSQFASLQFLDFNGDGRSDLCGRSRDGWRCWRGSGEELAPAGMDASPLLADGTGWEVDERGNSLRMVDLSGSGSRAVCGRSADGPDCLVNSGPPWELLTGWSNGRGASWEITYGSSAESDNLRLPTVIPVLSRLRTDPGGGGAASVLDFDYAGGFTNLRQRDFRGFAWLRITGPRGEVPGSPGNSPHRIRELWLHQGDDPKVLPWHFQAASEKWLFEMSRANEPMAGSHDARDPYGSLRGQPYRVLERDSAGTLYEERLLTYGADSNGPPFYHPLVREEALTCTGQDCKFPLPVVRSPIFRGNQADFDDQFAAALRASRVRGMFRLSSSRRSTSWTYDGLGNLLELREEGDPDTVADDRVTRFTYRNDTSSWLLGLETSKEVSQGEGAARQVLSRTTFEYDEPSVCDPPSAAAGARGLRTRETRWDGAASYSTSRFDYDRFGNRSCEVDPEGRRRSFEYDPATASRKIAEVNALGHRRELAYYGIGAPARAGAYGQLATVRDEAGSLTRISYDPLGRVSQVQRPQGASEQILLLDTGDPARQRLRRTFGNGDWEERGFDGLGRTTARRENGPEGRVLREDARYDARGHLAARSEPRFEGEAPRWVDLTRTSQGELAGIAYPDGRKESWCRARRSTYFSDASGRRQLEQVDAFGRKTRVADLKEIPVPEPPPLPFPLILRAEPPNAGLFEPLPKPCEGDRLEEAASLEIVYRGDDHPGALIDAQGHRTDLLYDSLGRRTGARFPNGRLQTTAYDRSDLELASTDARGAVHQWEYDAIGRPQSERWELGTETRSVAYRYDQGAFGVGRLSAVITSEAEIAYAYDALGHTVGETYTVGGIRRSLRTELDSKGRPVRKEFPDGLWVRLLYDGPVLSEVWDANERLIRFSSFAPTRLPRKTEYANGVVVERTFAGDPGAPCVAADLRLCREEVRRGATRLAARSYRYDPAGLVLGIDEGDATWELEYDSRSQLTRSIRRDTAGTAHTEELRYDSLGNLVRKGNLDFSYPGGSLLPEAAGTIGGQACTYDQDGRLLHWGSRSWSYDSAGRLSQVTYPAGAADRKLQLSYDGKGRLFSSQDAAARRWRLGEEAECTPEGCVNHLVIGGRRLLSRDSEGRLEFGVHDYLGSLRLVTDRQGNLIRRFDYDAWGALVASGAGAGDPLDRRRFAGGEWFPEIGIVHFGARFYEPELARFLTPDPIRLSDPQLHSFNPYAYAANNPFEWTDPAGLSPGSAVLAAARAWRDFAEKHPAAANILEGGAKVAIGGTGMVAAVETANPAMAYGAAHMATGGAVQLAIGVAQAFSSDQAAAAMQENWNKISNLLDPTKIYAGEIANLLGLDREVGYLGVDVFNFSKGFEKFGAFKSFTGKEAVYETGSSILGIKDLLSDLDLRLLEIARSVDKDKDREVGAHGHDDPFKGWEPRSIFVGDVPDRDPNRAHV